MTEEHLIMMLGKDMEWTMLYRRPNPHKNQQTSSKSVQCSMPTVVSDKESLTLEAYCTHKNTNTNH